MLHRLPPYYESNYTGTINLFEACLKIKPKKIVYLASIFALGKGTRDRPADEHIPYNLAEMAKKVYYFDAKRKAELASYDYLQKGLPIVHVYPCYCLGPGDVYLSSSKLVLAYMKGMVLGYIRGGLNIMDVRDAAQGLILGMEKGRIGEKYIIGDHNITFGELFQHLVHLTGKKPPKLAVPKRAGEITGRILEVLLGKYAPLDRATALIMGNYWYYDSTKAQKELGLRGSPLEETLRDAIEWFKTHRVHLTR